MISFLTGVDRKIKKEYKRIDDHLRFLNINDGKFVQEMSEEMKSLLIKSGAESEPKPDRTYQFLVNDGMVFMDETKGKKYVLSIKGFVHINTGGYEGQYLRENKNKFYRNIYLGLTILFSSVALYTSVESIVMQQDGINKLELVQSQQQKELNQLNKEYLILSYSLEPMSKKLHLFESHYQSLHDSLPKRNKTALPSEKK